MSLHLAEKAAARAAHCGVVAEEVAVLLHGGAAAGGVDDDGVDVGVLEDGNHAAGHGGSLLFKAGVDHQGSAAGLWPG